MNKFSLLFLLLFSALFFPLIAAEKATQQVAAITLPSADVEVAFIRGGQLKSLKIKTGEHIKVGQLIGELNRDLEENMLKQLEAQIADESEAKMESLNLKHYQQQFVQLQGGVKEGAVAHKELAAVELEVARSKVRLDSLIQQKNLLKIKLREAQIMLEQTRLHSPINGIVEEIQIEEGETVERNKPVLRIVRTNPLWIDVPVPLEIAMKMKLGQSLPVIFDHGIKKATHLSGKIIFIPQIADAASDILLVRISVENKLGLKAGVAVRVTLPAKQGKQ